MTLRSFGKIDPYIAADAYVDEAAIVIGDVAVGAASSVWPMCVLRGDDHIIRIGERTNIQDGTVIHVSHDGPPNPDGGLATEIGHDVTVGHKAIVHACTVEDRVLIGMGAMVLDGAVVRHDVIIAAGALVPPGKELDSGWLYVGSPAKAARELTDEEYRTIRQLAEHYVELGARHAAERKNHE